MQDKKGRTDKQEMEDYYKVVLLGSIQGKKVLKDMLHHLGVFAKCETPDEIARRNYGIGLIQMLSGYDDTVADLLIDSMDKKRKQ